MIATMNRSEAKAQKHTIEMQKKSDNRLNFEKMHKQLDKIMNRALEQGRRSNGWTCSIINNDAWFTPRYINKQYTYTARLSIENHETKKDGILQRDWDNLIKVIVPAADKETWSIATIDGKVADPDSDVRIERGGAVGYVPVSVPDDWRTGMAHIFDRDDQIDVIMASIQAGISTDFQDRFHCALVGEPACGKTETLRSLKNILGDDAVMEYDATATTQAGAIKDLDERECLPRILIVEEIEKTDEASLRWLLSVMDHRAEIRKVNFRSNIQKETRMLTLATVNDYDLFSKIMYGALASRFSYHIHFPRPDRKLLERILKREIDRVRGNHKWIKPTLDFAVSENIFDPRKVTAICLCGRDKLFSGEYQTKLKAVSVTNFLRGEKGKKKKAS